MKSTELDEIATHGFVVLPDLLDGRTCALIKEQLAPSLGGVHFGRNDFEGFRSERVYALLAKSPAIAQLVEHPSVLALVDELLSPAYLLSANLAINVHPGETAQLLHCDDAYCYMPRPRRHVAVSAIWAIDEFTSDNGATELIPGSHRWANETPAPDDDRIRRVEMPAGSVVVFLGTVWHRGGAHRGRTTRLAITPQYCEPWIRQIENMPLAVPPAMAKQMSERVQALLGYSIHQPFIGYVDGRDPRRLLRT
jgi:ectoine hydroxylase-related dioxygenase (phytanoyl-CoA dioxygenase family)